MTETLLPASAWPSLPTVHRRFLEGALPLLRQDRRLLGVTAGGSFATGRLDEQSDLDLVLVCEADVFEEVLAEGAQVAARLGPLLGAFVGEHVGERRLWICLYGPPLLHVDLKFVEPSHLAKRVEDPVVLWDRDGRVAAGLAAGEARYPPPDLQWVEDRFWAWAHYLGVKIERGELFEFLSGLEFVRRIAIGPFVLLEEGAQPNGVRRIEQLAPGRLEALRATLAEHEAGACWRALDATIALYAELRAHHAESGFVPSESAEREVRSWLAAR